MPISVVVGGQYGSEGKGKVAHFIARNRRAQIAVRVGGPNSGHTVIDQSGNRMVFRHLPTACVVPGVISVIPAGSYLNVEVLMREISLAASTQQVVIDPHAWIVTAADIQAERTGGLIPSIGSTGSGTGAAVIRRIGREGLGTFAKEVPELRQYLRDTPALLADALARNQRVVVEGTQGFGLSLLHSAAYPNCTSRDTTAATFTAEAGLSPIDVDEVVMVLRSFPIRVAGNSGPLPQEVDWDVVTRESGYSEQKIEFTSVTGKVRRVARFDPEVVKRAIIYNRPTVIAMNHLDYVDATFARDGRPTSRVARFVGEIEEQVGREINLLGFGPAGLTWRREKHQSAFA
jgi:adenylosuccinate synthase